MNYEENLNQNIFANRGEKSFIDKLLAKEDSRRMQELVRKADLDREDLLELLYLMSGTEAKLLNYGEWDRYIILKFFVWIREFIKIAEMMYDYEEFLDEQEKLGKLNMAPRTRKLISNNKKLISHNAKFLIDLYLNIARSSLSLGATGIIELLKNRFEYAYPQVGSGGQAPQKVQLGGK